jgi:hypothetical protein
MHRGKTTKPLRDSPMLKASLARPSDRPSAASSPSCSPSAVCPRSRRDRAESVRRERGAQRRSPTNYRRRGARRSFGQGQSSRRGACPLTASCVRLRRSARQQGPPLTFIPRNVNSPFPLRRTDFRGHSADTRRQNDAFRCARRSTRSLFSLEITTPTATERTRVQTPTPS